MAYSFLRGRFRKKICEHIVDVQMVEQLVKLLITESQDRIQQRTAEQNVDTSVPQVAED